MSNLNPLPAETLTESPTHPMKGLYVKQFVDENLGNSSMPGGFQAPRYWN